MGDHARFIFYGLSANETTYIQMSQDFIINFDVLLKTSRRQLTKSELVNLNQRILPLINQFRDFKLHLLNLTLDSNINLHIPPSSINDMLNELEEYVKTMKAQIDHEPSLFHPNHYHMFWLADALGHASSVSSHLDYMEHKLIEESNCFKMKLSNLSMRANIMNGYLRTQKKFPSLEQLNEEVGILIYNFKEFLEDIRDKSIDKRVLGTLTPLMVDHMAREECYYLWKLTRVAGLINRPNCDPTRQRIDL